MAGPLVGGAPPSEIRPPRIIQTVEPEFPFLLLHRQVTKGEVWVILVIDAEGHLADWMLRSYTHPMLAKEATEALLQWRFEPALVHGKPVDVRTEIIFTFQSSGGISVMTADDFQDRVKNSRLLLDQIRRVYAPDELDAPPAVLKAVQPLPLEPSAARQNGGRAVLDFYIDNEGRPRMPMVSRADDDAFAAAAAEALSHWRFAVPTRRGVPVSTRAEQVFIFNPPREG